MIALINQSFNSLLSDYADVLAVACAVLFLVLVIAIVLSVRRTKKLKKKNAELSTRLAATEKELIGAGRASVQSPAPAAKDKDERAPEVKAEEPEKIETVEPALAAVETKPAPEEIKPAPAAVETKPAPEEPKPAPASKASEKTEEPDDGVEEVPIGEVGAENSPEEKSEEKSEDAKPKRVSVATPRYIVKYDSKSHEWIVLKAGNTRATRRVKTKQEALVIAKELSKNSDAALIVHKKDGKFQKQ